MDRNETKQLLMAIDSLYGSKPVPDLTMKIDMWHGVLEDTTFENGMKNLKVHAKTNKFPPNPHHIVQQDEEAGPSIPTYEETQRREYIKEHYDEIRHPENGFVIGYAPKKVMTEAERKEDSEERQMRGVVLGIKFGIGVSEELQNRLAAYREKHPEKVAEWEAQEYDSQPKKEVSVSHQWMVENERNLKEIRKNLK